MKHFPFSKFFIQFFDIFFEKQTIFIPFSPVVNANFKFYQLPRFLFGKRGSVKIDKTKPAKATDFLPPKLLLFRLQFRELR